MKLKYRPEIDGLRAIAVFAVIFYHAEIFIFGINPFKGGFFGVDIFFVISGYLISLLILNEIKTTGSFSFINFYERRARRILPALFFIMIVSIPAAWMWLLPTSSVDYAKSLISSVFFSSNFYFYFTNLEYAGESALLKPFLHTWSLSVEEQYYIIYPFILIICLKYFKKYLLGLLILGLIVSLQFADWGSRNQPLLNFYILPSRGWELLAGAILAKLEIDYGRINKKLLSNIMPMIGIILIIVSILFYDDKVLHPSYYSLPPVIGVMLIIYFSHERGFVNNILSGKVLVGLGLISYSLYLWHYPIFAFSRITDFATLSIYKKLILGVAVIVFSILTYFLIERPFRNRSKINFKLLNKLLLGKFLIIIIFSSIIIFQDGFKNRFKNFENVELDNSFLMDKWQNMQKEIGIPILSESNDKKKVLVIGNSHGDDLFRSFYYNKDLFSNYEFSILGTQIHCLHDNIKNNLQLKCLIPETFNKDKRLVLNKINQTNFKRADILILSSRWDAKDINALKKIKSYVKDKKIIMVTSGLGFNYNSSSIHTALDKFLLDVNRTERKILKEVKDEIEKIYFKLLDKKVLQLNSKLQHEVKNLDLIFLNKKDYACDIKKKKCDVLTPNGFKIYHDELHYTFEGAKYFGKKMYDMDFLKTK